MYASILAQSFLVQSLIVQIVVWIVLGVVALLGLLALLSPQRFAALSDHGSRWVDTNSLLQKLDQPVNLDQRVLQYSRVFGALVIGAAALLGWVVFTYVL